MSNYNDIPVGLRVPTGVPLDAKLWRKSKVELESLGPSNNLAYTYYEGMRIYCVEEREIYEWLEENKASGLGLTPLLPIGFTYPIGYNLNGINYGGKTYNFYKVIQAWDINLPEIINVGNNIEIYKGLINNKHQFKTINRELQLPEEPGQLVGSDEIKFDIIEKEDVLTFRLDLSDLTVPIQQTGIPEFYVHSGADPSIADGSIVRPYQDWESCKNAIIGSTGSIANPEYLGARVTFLTNITSSEDFSIRNLNIRFENRSRFTYTNTDMEAPLLDLEKIKNAGATSSEHTFSGEGSISNMTKVAIRVFSDQSNFRGYVTIASGASISIEEKFSSSYIASNFIETDTTNGAGRPVFVMDKVGGVDKDPPYEGLISIKGVNSPTRDSMNVEEGAHLRIRSSVNPAIHIVDGVMIYYGTISLSFGESVTMTTSQGNVNSSFVRYGTDSGGGDVGGRFSPSDTVSQIYIETRAPGTFYAQLTASGNGTISGNFLGSTRQGGYKAAVELVGRDSSMFSTNLNWNDNNKYKYFLYISDTSSTSSKKKFIVRNVFTQVSPEEYMIAGSAGVNNTNTEVQITEGIFEVSNNLGRLIQPGLSLNIISYLSSFAGKIYSSNITSHSNRSAALAEGLLPGMIFYDESVKALNVVA